MIELATDPNASRMSYRPGRGDDEAKDPPPEARRGRPGHAWPFLSHYEARPAREESQKAKASDSGS